MYAIGSARSTSLMRKGRAWALPPTNVAMPVISPRARIAAAAQLAVVGEGFREPHAYGGSEGRGEPDQKRRPRAGDIGGGEDRRERGNGAVDQADETRLDHLEEPRAIVSGAPWIRRRWLRQRKSAEKRSCATGISLPTVYATLDLFEQLGIVRRISPGEGPVLYDPRAEEHHHLVCRRCGAVEDVGLGLDTAPAPATARRRGFTPDHAGLVISGVCRRCA